MTIKEELITMQKTLRELEKNNFDDSKKGGIISDYLKGKSDAYKIVGSMVRDILKNKYFKKVY